MIHRRGTQLVDGSGQPIKLKGVNLGGWLLWEGWIWGGGFDAEKKIMNRLNDLVGKEAAIKFRDDIHNNFITESDFRSIAELGFNVIRLPFNHTILEDDDKPFVYKDSGWAILDRAISWAKKYNIYVVLDLHALPGGQSSYFPSDPDDDRLWDSKENMQRSVALWKTIAQRYKDQTIVAGYDLVNEPIPKNKSIFVELYNQMIAAIREVDPNHLIIIEGADFSRDFSMFEQPLTENQAYSFHLYTWSNLFGDEFEKLARYDDVAKKHNIPLWNGEMGENKPELVAKSVDKFNQDDLISGWCYWTWKKVLNHFPCLVEIKVSDHWKKLIKWTSISLPWNKPSKEEALSGMEDFISAVRFENNLINQEMVQALAPKQQSVNSTAGSGTDLTATYFDDESLNHQKLTRIDPIINFDWGWDAPDKNIPSDHFSARWTGFILPSYSETYTFYVNSDDGARLWVDNQLLIDNWKEGAHTSSGKISLTAGQKYNIKLEYYENAGLAKLQLFWSSIRQSKEDIPQSKLYPVKP